MPARSNGLLGTASSQRVTTVHVKVQVLGILIPTEVGQDPARSILARNLVCNSAYYRQHFVQENLVGSPEVNQRWYVPLWNDNDMHWPEWPCMPESKDFVRLRNDFDRRPATERFVAIEVLAHCALCA
jgi:hypothetical protein